MNKLLLVALSSLVVGCASVASSRYKEGTESGLLYFLPKQYMVLTLTNSDEKRTLSLAESPVLPDVDRGFVAKFVRNHVGKNELSVGTTEGGLLSGTAKASTVSQVSEILKAAARSLAYREVAFRSGQNADRCVDGTYKWYVDPALEASVSAIREADTERGGEKVGESEDRMPPASVNELSRSVVAIEDPNRSLASVSMKECGIQLEVKRLFTEMVPTQNKHVGTQEHSHSGFFYRRPVPYSVSAQIGASGGRVDTIVLLPTSDSPVLLLPVERSLFSVNNAEFAFSNGMPSSYKQDLDSELLGLVKLPADVLQAYFGALTSAFTERKAALTNEGAYLDQSRALYIQETKAKNCMDAVATGDNAAITAACG